MIRSHWILVILYTLALCQRLDFQSTATNIATQAQSASSTSSPIASTVSSSNNVVTNSYNSSTQSYNSSTQSYNSSTSAGPKTPSAQITEVPISGKYSGTIRMKCLFPDVFLPDYNNNSSPLFHSYIQNIFSKMSSSLAKQSLQLVLIGFFTISPGSVVVDMSLTMLSNVMMDNSIFLNVVWDATVDAFSGEVKILSIKIQNGFTPTPQSSAWIAVIVIIVVISIILMIIGLALCHHYTPHYFFCTCLKSPRIPPPITSNTDTPHTEYGVEYNTYSDKTAIIDRDGNEFA